MSRAWRGRVPWWVRIALKIVMARLPVPYRWWKRVRLFEHGTMDRPEVAVNTLLAHARTAGLIDDSGAVPRFATRPNMTMLEIGPGDSLASGIVAAALGVERSVLIDAGDFATHDLEVYRRLVDQLATAGHQLPPGGGAARDLDALLQACGVSYLTNGVDSLAALPAASVDFCFSNAVLEHVPKAEFERFARELRRVLRPGGVCVHRVDFKDHLGGALNNLRFSESMWEGRLFTGSGFYTNRIRPRAMCRLFEAAGWRCEAVREQRWPALPTARAAMHREFSDLPDEELLVSDMDLRLR